MTDTSLESARPARIASLTTLALVCFAANSLFARAALRGAEIDPASYTSLRLASGALALWLIVRLTRTSSPDRRAGSWASAAALFLYAAPFSFAYVALPTGTGALILFGVVQLTMFATSIARGERPSALEWTGLFVAFAGLVWLMLPGIATPDPSSAVLMALAGVAWGVYTLRGRGSRNPLAATADNFLRAVAMTAVLSIATMGSARTTTTGALLACASGALASGIGYSIWYAALRHLTAARAGIVQLSVPVLTALAGTILLAEPMTMRLVLAGIAIVGGIALAIAGRVR
jgi:drug/metabolite transporter (DMT)-like permease